MSIFDNLMLLWSRRLVYALSLKPWEIDVIFSTWEVVVMRKICRSFNIGSRGHDFTSLGHNIRMVLPLQNNLVATTKLSKLNMFSSLFWYNFTVFLYNSFFFFFTVFTVKIHCVSERANLHISICCCVPYKKHKFMIIKTLFYYVKITNGFHEG